MTEFDSEAHEQRVAERYEQLARYQAFDHLVDMALDGTVTLDEAITAYKEEVAENVVNLQAARAARQTDPEPPAAA